MESGRGGLVLCVLRTSKPAERKRSEGTVVGAEFKPCNAAAAAVGEGCRGGAEGARPTKTMTMPA